MEAHLTFDTNLSVYMKLSVEELVAITGRPEHVVTAAMREDDLDDILPRELLPKLLELGKARFMSEYRLTVGTCDIELAVMEAY